MTESALICGLCKSETYYSYLLATWRCDRCNANWTTAMAALKAKDMLPNHLCPMCDNILLEYIVEKNIWVCPLCESVWETTWLDTEGMEE
mgnify:CR=1 FL=1